ncbi:hypothetical protein AWM79_23955 [Pseudomonas agarici]|uniref:Uncharacterized protein n=1 Tax=Pseudomonas agarici TaxID=46677 RepID=A0A0X1T8B8_PSEAA|nr:hypothetical protein AWM79_23955 [Pseudomonas agarici]
MGIMSLIDVGQAAACLERIMGYDSNVAGTRAKKRVNEWTMQTDAPAEPFVFVADSIRVIAAVNGQWIGAWR